MFRKILSILIMTGMMSMSIVALAQQNKTENLVQIQNRTQKQAGESVQAGSPSPGTSVNTTERGDRLRTRDRKMDGSGDHDPDRMHDRDRDRIHDYQNMGQGMGSGMRGTRK